MAAAPPSPCPAGSRWGQDGGGVACPLSDGESRIPPKHPRSQARTREPTRANQARPWRRLAQVHRRGKSWRRVWKDGVRDLVMAQCGALHHFRVRLTPCQPMLESG